MPSAVCVKTFSSNASTSAARKYLFSGAPFSAIAAVRYAATDYLLKPIGIPDLCARVGAILGESLATRARNAQLRPSRLQGAAFREIADWLGDYRAYWDETFDRLDEHLRGG